MRVTVYSSRWDRPPATLRRAAARMHGPVGATLGLWTEVELPARRRALGRPASVDAVLAGGAPKWGRADDTAVTLGFDQPSIRVLYHERFTPTRRRVRRPDGKLRDPLRCTITVLEIDGRPSVWGVIHAPSSVEREVLRRRFTAPRPLQWYRAVRGLKRRVNRLARRHRCEGRKAIGGDININVKRLAARAVLRSIAPAWRIASPTTGRGTHGPRIIDALLVGRGWQIGPSKVMRKGPSSDHRPLWVDLTPRRRRGRP